MAATTAFGLMPVAAKFFRVLAPLPFPFALLTLATYCRAY